MGGAALIRFKLSVMMFLEFFIWGAWFPLIFGYLPSLGFNELEQAFVTGAFNLAAFTAMFFSTQFVDRHFAAERFLAFSQLIGGAAIIGLFWVREGWSLSIFGQEVNLTFCAFFSLMLLHSLFYVPTISITNSIAFANLRDPRHEFGPVRLWGTIGWIAAAWPFVFILIDWQRVPAFDALPPLEWLSTALGSGMTGAALRESTRYIFLVAGIASLVLAVFSLALPHTPPRPAELTGEKFAWLEAMKLLRVPFILVLFIVTFFDAAVHQCYFFWTPRFLESESVGIPGNWVTPVMSIGQVAEIGTMVFLGYCLKRLGWRTTMAIGILGHAVRFGVFAFIPGPVPAIIVNLLHGICYAFFFAAVYIFVDEFFPKDARSSAQGLFNFLILGLGPFASNFLWAYLGTAFQIPGDGIDFQRLFLVPASIGLGASLLLLLFFRPPRKAVTGELPPEIESALARDDVWMPPPSEAITEKPKGIKE
jgi:MFS family permease